MDAVTMMVVVVAGVIVAATQPGRVVTATRSGVHRAATATWVYRVASATLAATPVGEQLLIVGCLPAACYHHPLRLRLLLHRRLHRRLQRITTG